MAFTPQRAALLVRAGALIFLLVAVPSQSASLQVIAGDPPPAESAPPSVDLSKIVSVVELSPDGTETPLVDGATVTTKSVLIVRFDKDGHSIAGQIGVRARILRDTPVELPVDNFTLVNRDSLRQQQPATIPESYLRGDSYNLKLDTDLESIMSSAAQIFGAGAAVDNLYSDLYVSNPNERPVPRPLDKVDIAATRKDYQLARSALKEVGTSSSQLAQALDTLAQDIASAFSGTATSALTQHTFADLQKQVFRTEIDLKSWGARVHSSQTSGELSACTAGTPNAELSCFVGQYAGSAPAFHSLANAVASGIEDITIAENVENRFREQLDAVRQKIEKMRALMIDDYQRTFSGRLLDGRIHLAEADLRHGDTIEVAITNDVSALSANGSAPVGLDSSQHNQYTVRLRLRAVSLGFDYAIGPQLVLVRRVPAVGPGDPIEVPANFVPAPGVAFAVRYRTRAQWSDWVIPSIDIVATLVHFRSDRQLELGAGLGIGLLNDMIHLGRGIDLSSPTHTQYWFLSLDFAQTFGVFGDFFGTGNSQKPQ